MTAPRIPTLAELPAAPRRIVLHWTAGAHRPNAIDLEHYHYLVTGDGEIVLGRHGVAANMRQLQRGDAYAAHTGGLNSYSVGVSFCAMWGAKPGGPFGPAPLLEDQVTAGLRFVGQLCAAWRLNPTDPEHLHTHTEAWTLHRVRGSRNHEKWDITVLPYLPEVPADRVGDLLRAEAYMLGVPWPAASVVTPPRPPTLIAT
jgi:hypothetical protein